MPPVGFKPTISEGERQQNYALDRASTGTGTTASYILLSTCLDMRREQTYSAVLVANTECSNSRLAARKIVTTYGM